MQSITKALLYTKHCIYEISNVQFCLVHRLWCVVLRFIARGPNIFSISNFNYNTVSFIITQQQLSTVLTFNGV